MTDPDPNGPMQGPRSTHDVMKRAPLPPVADDDAPDAPATDAATTAVEVDQEAA